MLPAFSQLSDDQLFAEVNARRERGEDFGAPLGELCERWREAACTTVRRVQGGFMRGSPDDQAELFQESVSKLIARGLSQFRGVSELSPGTAASPRAFFLRIVKHAAIDRYRRHREELEGPSHPDDAAEEPAHEVRGALEHAERKEQQADARQTYWAAFARLRQEHPNEASAWDLYHHQDVDDHAECARQLGISMANSYKRVSRAQAYLKLYLLEQMGTEEA